VRALARALASDGKRIAISKAMMPITTKSSINVKAFSLWSQSTSKRT
jgi:hypothetical protein